VTRQEFEASVRATASLTQQQYAVIFAAADEYGAHLIEEAMRPPWRADRRAS
jgi:hypothetical protein